MHEDMVKRRKGNKFKIHFVTFDAFDRDMWGQGLLLCTFTTMEDEWEYKKLRFKYISLFRQKKNIIFVTLFSKIFIQKSI